MGHSYSSLDMPTSLWCKAKTEQATENQILHGHSWSPAWTEARPTTISQMFNNISNVKWVYFLLHLQPLGTGPALHHGRVQRRFFSGKNSTLHSTLVHSSPSKQIWKQHKTPENSGVAFGKIKGEGGERHAEVLFIWHFPSLQRPPT